MGRGTEGHELTLGFPQPPIGSDEVTLGGPEETENVSDGAEEVEAVSEVLARTGPELALEHAARRPSPSSANTSANEAAPNAQVASVGRGSPSSYNESRVALASSR